MESTTKIVIPDGYLDVDENIGFGVTYSVDDVRNIDTANSTFSKTIILPATKNNNVLLGNLFNINETFTFFNPNVRTNGFILVNDTVVLKGYFQLKNIKKVNSGNLEGSKMQYEIVFFDDTIDLLDKIGETRLNDLDLSVLNHRWDYESITKTWGLDEFQVACPTCNYQNFTNTDTPHTWKDGYTYPTFFKGNLTDSNLLNDGSRDYETKDFYPAIFLKYYLWRIAKESGLMFSGDFWDNNETFAKEIIPYNGDIPQAAEAVADSPVLFQVGLSGATGTGWTHTTRTFPQTGTYGDERSDGTFANPIIPSLYCVPFDNDATLPFYDQGETTTPVEAGNWENANYGFSPVENGYHDVYGNIVVKVTVSTFRNSVPVTATIENIEGDMQLDFNVKEYNKVSLLEDTSKVLPKIHGEIIYPYTITQTEDFYIELNGLLASEAYLTTEDILIPLLNFRTHPPIYVDGFGQQCEVRIVVEVLPELPSNITHKTLIYNATRTGKLSNGQFATLEEGQVLNMNAFVPKNVKQIDLLTDLIKRYNLYITTDPQNPNKLNLITKDRFYQLGASKEFDWTDKKDNNQEEKISLLQELQNKRVTFSYTLGQDDYSKAYKQATGEVYGLKKIEFSNQFASGEKKVTSIFESTPLLQDYLGGNGATKIVPAINTTQPKTGLRILLFNGLKPTVKGRGWKYTFWDSSLARYTYVTLNVYPYAGHLDDPYNPSEDINYNQVPYTFYPQLTEVTNGNLYNIYWRNTCNSISTGKLFSAHYHLTETDINDVKDDLGSRIWVRDSWYTINRINDFDPTNEGTTQVELLKQNDPTPFRKKIRLITKPIADIGTVDSGHVSGTTYIPIDVQDETEHGVKSVGTGDAGGGGGGETGGGGVSEVSVAVFPVDDGVSNLTSVGGAGIDEEPINLITGGYNELRDPFSTISLNLIKGGTNTLRDPFPSSDLGYIHVLDGSVGERFWVEATNVNQKPRFKSKKDNTKLDSSL